MSLEALEMEPKQMIRFLAWFNQNIGVEYEDSENEIDMSDLEPGKFCIAEDKVKELVEDKFREFAFDHC